MHGFLGTREPRFLNSTVRSRARSASPAQGDHASRRRSVSQEQLSGLPALSRSRSRDRRRCGSNAAVADRSVQTPASPTDRKTRLRSSRQEAWPKHSREALEQARAGMPPTAGTRARSAPRACRRKCGSRSRTKIGRWCPTPAWIQRLAAAACGTSTSTISTSAGGRRGVGYGAPAPRRRGARESEARPAERRAFRTMAI